MSERELPRFLAWLGRLQAQRPFLLLLVAVLSLLPAAYATLQLTLKPDLAELLPENKDSVITARRVGKRLSGASTLTVTAEIDDGKNWEALPRFYEALAPKLMALGPDQVGRVDFNTKARDQFFHDNKILFAKTEDIQKAHDEIVERYDYEVAKQTGQLIDDTVPEPITPASIRKRLTGKAEAPPPETGPRASGYYINEEGTFAAMLIRTPVSGKANVRALRDAVEKAVAETNPASFDGTMKIRYTGGIITSNEDYEAIVNDLAHVGGWGLLGVLGSVFLFFLRFRVLAVMGATILIGLLWTFGLTHYTIGYLNASTGFLVSIIAGNGINYGIMYMARYVEARRDEHRGVEDAILVAHRDSWVPTLASAATAMLAYGSLIITDFRGFKHFGIIGSYGMMICWGVTYVFMPALLAATERALPSYRTDEDKRSKARGYYGLPFAKLATTFPRGLSVVGLLLLLGTVAASVAYFRGDPQEYDMANIRNERKDKTAAGLLSMRVDKVADNIGQDGMAVMTDRLDQVKPLVAELEKRYEAAPANLKPFERVVTIYSLLPEDQAKKLPLVEEIRDRLIRAHQRGMFSPEEWAELDGNLPKGPLKIIGIDDLPEPVARPFTEKDGTRGRIVFIAPKQGRSVWDAKYLMLWADSFRETKLPNGEVIHGSGSSVIYADMIRTIGEDSPKAIAVSALGSILVILVAFRGHRHSWAVFIPWLLGVSSLLAFLYLRDIKLNFLNFVAVPITIGIGAEYAHNLVQRYRVEDEARIFRVVVETGGAVITCAMTTTIGYLALMLSINRGIVTFGLAAAAGELFCVLAAVLFLPASLVWMAKRKGIEQEK
jgi:uncharacterized protein